jgi:hypothetical protein
MWPALIPALDTFLIISIYHKPNPLFYTAVKLNVKSRQANHIDSVHTLELYAQYFIVAKALIASLRKYT